MATQGSDPATAPDTPQRSPPHVNLDGRTLEGGGQLLRNAVALSALTGRPITVNHIRGNRQGKTGLKGSHAAAVKLLAEISRSTVSDGRVGAQNMTFEPQSLIARDTTSPATSLVPLSNVAVKSQYDIRLNSPGSIFLIFQALYPYLLHVGSQASTSHLSLTITGGTNGSRALSYDYASQVMAPNFARLGLPPLSITLHKRGWSTGPVGMGTVTFSIQPLGPLDDKDAQQKDQQRSITDNYINPPTIAAEPRFPHIDIMSHERGKINQIDITVLATDNVVPGESQPVRKYVERMTRKTLRQALAALDPSTFDVASDPTLSLDENVDGASDRKASVPIRIHASEPTSHIARLYLLIVAHTSTGFRIGHDKLLEDIKSGKHPKQKHKNTKKNKQQRGQAGQQQSELARITGLVEQCVEGFIAELSDGPNLSKSQASGEVSGSRSLFDSHMRDQVVVFEALGRLGRERSAPQIQEDQRFWTLHTQTARWVCQEILGDVWD